MTNNNESPEVTKDQNPYTLHIILATIPLYEHGTYIRLTEEKFFKEYRKNAGTYYGEDLEEHLYKPEKYYMFGTYDIAFISLIDSFRFAQKLFIPTNLPEDDGFSPSSFQIITGICIGHSLESENKNLGEFYKDILCNESTGFDRLFFGIINLKINNALLIGNGNDVFEPFLKTIKEKLQACRKSQHFEYAILQSLGWYEINIVCFCEDINVISGLLKDLRETKLGGLGQADHERIVKNSIYYLSESQRLQQERLDKEKAKKVGNGGGTANQGHVESATEGGTLIQEPELKHFLDVVYLLSDTQTYLGLKYDTLVSKEPATEQRLKRRLEQANITTEVEWLIKPGHLGSLLHKLKELPKFANIIPPDGHPEQLEAYTLTGKSDYLIPSSRSNLADDVELFKSLMDKNNGYERHIRKIKTKILLQAVYKNPLTANNIPYHEVIRKLGLNKDRIEATNEVLKEEKISRVLRNKIIKIFYSYNNGIQDHVMLPYFLDFSGYIESFQREISISLRDKNGAVPVAELEDKFRRYVQTFEDGQKIRSLNSYNFEDINDVNLDFNTSIQQLLSIYSNLILQVSNLFYPNGGYSPIVRLNLNDTVANVISINYNIYHLISPEFVFATITKEILNKYREIKQNLSLATDKSVIEKIDELESYFNNALAGNSYLADYKDTGTIDFNNLLIDALRFMFTYNADFGLFTYWLWTYNFQNSSLYNLRGGMDEKYFRAELVRIMFVAKLFGHEVPYESCPLPDIQSYWSRYYHKTKEVIDELMGKEMVARFGIVIEDMLKSPLREQMKDCYLPAHCAPKGNGGGTGHGKQHLAPECFRLLHERAAHFAVLGEEFSKAIGNGKAVYYREEKHGSNDCFIASLLYYYLNAVAEKNGKTIKLLKRNWDNGMLHKAYINASRDSHTFCVDPMGGIFFDTHKKQKEYFMMRNALLQSLWHLSLLQKGKYIRTKCSRAQ